MEGVLGGFIEGGQAFLDFVGGHFAELLGEDLGKVLEPIQRITQFMGDDAV